MKPIFKYSGGKTREAKLISSLIDVNPKRIVEPFAGSCAIAFHHELPALVADTRDSVVTTLSACQDKKLYPLLQERLEVLRKERDISKLEKAFYHARDDMFLLRDKLDIAYRFIVIRQLVFSGMDRVNTKTGKENAPFGWYKEFKCSLSDNHHKLLQSWEIKKQPFETTFEQVRDDDVVFLDPPYLGRNSSYGADDTNVQVHVRLQQLCELTNKNWMLVHCEHPMYDSFAARYKTTSKEFRYAQNFKGRKNDAQKTLHLYIKNF